MNRLQEIEERLAAIKLEIDADGADLDALETEISALKEERKCIMDKVEKRKNLIDGIINLPDANIIKDFKEERKDMDFIEERAQKLYETGSMSITAAEARSITLATGTLAKPTGVGGINDPFNTVSSIIDLVMVEDLTGLGSYKEGYVKSWQTAEIGTDGTAPGGSGQSIVDPVFRTVSIDPKLVDTITYVSKNLKKQTPLKYEEKVRQGALIALRKKAVSLIIGGNGSTEPFGIYNAVNTEASPESMTQELLLSSSTIGEKTLRNIVFAYGGDENVGGGAKLFLNKLDLIAFGDVRGTAEKKAVYEIIPDGANPNIGIIKDGGLSVPYVICSDVTYLTGKSQGASKVPTMIYGAPGAYKLGLFGDYEVNVSTDYKFAEGLLSVKGEAMIGGNVIVDKGFVVVTLAANA